MSQLGRPQNSSRRIAECRLWLVDYLRDHPNPDPVQTTYAAFCAGWSAAQRRERTPDEYESAWAAALQQLEPLKGTS